MKTFAIGIVNQWHGMTAAKIAKRFNFWDFRFEIAECDCCGEMLYKVNLIILGIGLILEFIIKQEKPNENPDHAS